MAKKKRVSGFVLGGMMILGGISGLFWNEWRSAHRIATLIEGENQAVSVNQGKIAQGHDGKPVHVTGEVTLDGRAIDPVFEVTRPAARLERRVEMFQWRETKQGSDGDRETIYERVWAEGRIQSENFEQSAGRANPPWPNLASENFYPETVRIGDYIIRPHLLDRIRGLDDLPPPEPLAVRIEGLQFATDGNYLTTGRLSAPEIGDIRLSWREAPATTYALLAGQEGIELGTWRASNGGEIAMIERGEFSMPEMFDMAYGENTKVTWAARGGFTLALFIGFSILLRRLAKAIPLLGVVAAKFAKPLAAILTAATALLTIAAGWLIFRPLFSLGLIVIAAAVIFAIRWMRAGAEDEDLAHPPPPPPPSTTQPPPAPVN